MPRPKKQRVPTVPITQSEYDQKYHAYLNVGKKPNGKDDIRHRSGDTYDACAQKIFAIEDAVAAKGHAPDAGRSTKLSDYLRQWHSEGMRPVKRGDGTIRARWKYSTGRDYRNTIERYVIPFAGEHRLDEFTRTTRHGKKMLAMVGEKVSQHAAHKAHTMLRSALADAEEDDLVYRNVMRAISPPQVDAAEEQFLTVAEGRAILAAIERRPRLKSRWLMAVGLGQRQGECLGLQWHRPDTRYNAGDVDLDAGTITVREKLLRKYHQHGCPDPVVCNKTRTREDRDGNKVPYNPCHITPCEPLYVHGCDATCGKKLARYCPDRDRKGPCYRHVDKEGQPKPCPPLCPPDCGRHASTCPQRQEGNGLVREDPKSKAGKRTVKMPRPIWEAFRQRKTEQDAERELAADLWAEHGYVHSTSLGGPIDPRADWEEWQKLLAEAGVDPIKLHAARHFAATILLLLKVEKRVIMHILGWSSDMTKRYQHILDEMLAEVAGQLEDFLWPSAPVQPGPPVSFRKAKDQKRSSSTDLSTSNVIQFRPRAV